MKTQSTEAHYEIFGRMLLEDKVYLDPSVTFDMICRWIGADRHLLDALVRRELGISGQALMRLYRAREPQRLVAKYALPEP